MNKAIFISLDNTLITTLSRRALPLHSDDWKFKIEILPILKKAINSNYILIIVTNQKSVTDGFTKEKVFINKLNNIVKTLEKNLKIKTNTKVFFNYSIEEKTDYRSLPNPGMGYELALDYELDLSKSIMIGNSLIDKTFSNNLNLSNYYNITDINEDIV